MTQVTQLANTFSKIVREELADCLLEINIRNDKRSDITCATQDFCDANMLMLEAWEEVVGSFPSAESEEDATLWNAAWAKAKSHHFS